MKKAFGWWIFFVIAALGVLEHMNLCRGAHLLDGRCYASGDVPGLFSFLLIPIIVIPMWWAHEELGWFGGYQSSSDAPRMFEHPRHDKI